MDFNIRLAEVLDVPALLMLFNSDKNIFGEDETGFGERDIMEYVLDERKKLFVCELDKKIVGALMAEYHETYSHLETLIVDKPFQKNGAGSALLDHYEKDLESLKIPLIEVMTEAGNSVMQKLLVSRGFRKGNSFVFYAKGE